MILNVLHVLFMSYIIKHVLLGIEVLPLEIKYVAILTLPEREPPVQLERNRLSELVSRSQPDDSLLSRVVAGPEARPWNKE